jgi:anti-sigma regulatory factor (Ser/Thr protein kinase)
METMTKNRNNTLDDRTLIWNRTVEFKIANSSRGLGDLKESLARATHSWNLPAKMMLELNLIIEELCVNHVEHSEELEAGYIEIDLSIDDEKCITVTVTDSGPPFNPVDVPPPDINLPIEQRSEGGLGLHFVRHYTDTLTYSRDDNKNVVTMTKKLKDT